MRAHEFDHSRIDLNEDLRKWFKEKWVRFGPDGKIRGDCARGSKSEGKPKCLPQSKARALGQKGRASAASRKRREDPNPERRGAAKNVATKSKNMKESIDLDLYDDDEQIMAPDAIFTAAREVVPELKFKDTGEGYARLYSDNGLELHIGVSIIEGDISINIGSGFGLATSGGDSGAVTEIIRAVYDAAVREYGQPDQPGFLVIDYDAGHGVWQRIAQNLGLQYEAHVVKEHGRRMEESLSPKVIHRLADRKGVKWDDEPSFLKKTKQLTGKTCLDKLNQNELKKVKAWLTSLEENFADGRGPGRPGDSARLGIPKSATIAQLEKIRSNSKSSKRKKQLAHWQINMRRGKKKS